MTPLKRNFGSHEQLLVGGQNVVATVFCMHAQLFAISLVTMQEIWVMLIEVQCFVC